MYLFPCLGNHFRRIIGRFQAFHTACKTLGNQARATGKLTNSRLDLDATLKDAADILVTSSTTKPGGTTGGGTTTPSGGSDSNPSGGSGSNPSGGTGSNPSGGENTGGEGE